MIVKAASRSTAHNVAGCRALNFAEIPVGDPYKNVPGGEANMVSPAKNNSSIFETQKGMLRRDPHRKAPQFVMETPPVRYPSMTTPVVRLSIYKKRNLHIYSHVRAGTAAVTC